MNILEGIRYATYQFWIDRAEKKGKKMLKQAIDEKYSSLSVEARNELYQKYTNVENLYTTRSYPFTGTNVTDPGAFNAFMHAYTSAKMARNPLTIGGTLTFAFAKEAVNYPSDWKHKLAGNIPLINLDDLDHNRDWYNNFYGIKKGFGKILWSDKKVAREIFDALENGELITSAKDSQRRLAPNYETWEKMTGDNLYNTVEKRELEYYLKKYNQPKDFSTLQPSKLDELKNPPVQGISGSVADATNIGMNVIQPQPVILSQNTTSWLGQLGQVLSGLGSLVQLGVGVAGGINALNTPKVTTSVSGKIVTPGVQLHTGGKVSGRDEVLAILRGGETVRTEAQEQELQQEQYGRFMEAIRPYLEERENKPKTIAEAYDPNNKIPCLLNKTTQDEELIISIIAQAWKTNRLGFRNVLRYE